MFLLTVLPFRNEDDCDLISKTLIVITFPCESWFSYNDSTTKLVYIDFSDNHIDHLLLLVFTLVARVVR